MAVGRVNVGGGRSFLPLLNWEINMEHIWESDTGLIASSIEGIDVDDNDNTYIWHSQGIIKMNKNGGIVWEKSIGNRPIYYPNFMTSRNGISYYGTTDGKVILLNADGDQLAELITPGERVIHSVYIDENNNVYAGSIANSTYWPSNFVKFNQEGIVEWHKTTSSYGIIHIFVNTIANKVGIVRRDNNYLNVYIYDLEGERLFNSTNLQTNSSKPKIAVDNEGNAYLSVDSTNKVFVYKLVDNEYQERQEEGRLDLLGRTPVVDKNNNIYGSKMIYNATNDTCIKLDFFAHNFKTDAISKDGFVYTYEGSMIEKYNLGIKPIK